MTTRFLLLFSLLTVFGPWAGAQIAWRDTSLSFSELEWNNYSTSFLGEGSDSLPLLVTAIPYNGIYEMSDDESDRTALDMTFSGSGYRFRSNLEAGQNVLYTYDSSAVYFLAPGIFRSNAARYEFRVSEADGTVVRPWGAIEAFADDDFQLNQFREGFAFLGGFSSVWGHCLVAELREKGRQHILSGATVCWQETRPALLSVLTMDELNERLLRLKKPFDLSFDANEQQKWAKSYPPEELDSITGLPKHLVLPPGEDELLFFLRANIYRKEALEYRLLKNGRTSGPWRPNDVDNNFIWLRGLAPGDYVLEMRYAKQRHNVTAYPFSIAAAWYQSWLFKMLAAALTIVFFASLVLLYQLRRQRQKTAAEQAKQERLALGLKSIYAQLNPHFIFNALSSIQGLVNKNDIAGANRYLSAFGNLVRNSLTGSEKTFIPLEQEIGTLDTYLSLEQLRFGFSYSIRLAENFPVTVVEIPSLLLQPLVENAVKHGVAAMQEKGEVRVTFHTRQQDMIVQIADNGQGFLPEKQVGGYGLKLTADRIHLLNELSAGRFITLTIRSAPDEGATIELLFKNWLV